MGSNLKDKKGENCVHFLKLWDVTVYFMLLRKPIERKRE